MLIGQNVIGRNDYVPSKTVRYGESIKLEDWYGGAIVFKMSVTYYISGSLPLCHGPWIKWYQAFSRGLETNIPYFLNLF